MMDPYIGITGFSKPEEVSAALEMFPYHRNRNLMVGALVTWKSLRGIPMEPKWAKRTPKPALLEELFRKDKRVVNLVHFSTEDKQKSSVLADMLKIHNLAGPDFHGFQLNIAWPEIRLMDEYRSAVGYAPRLVLQIGHRAMGAVGGTPRGVVNMLYHYVGVVDDVLFDPSCGLGKPLETEEARKFLGAIRDEGWGIGLGVAGGLGPDSLHLIEPLVAEFPDLNIDAEGRLRNAENKLDLNAVSAYLSGALQIFV